MASILLVGTDAALLEGLAQSLVAAGHAPRLAGTVAEGTELAASDPPLVAVVDRGLAALDSRVLGLPLSRGGALVLYRTSAAAAGTLAPAFVRAALADLSLPLERHRLLALIGRVEERARTTGRGPRETPPEQRAL